MSLSHQSSEKKGFSVKSCDETPNSAEFCESRQLRNYVHVQVLFSSETFPESFLRPLKKKRNLNVKIVGKKTVLYQK